ncbi:MAG: hypothetical protein K2Q13_05080 [Nitrosomonas sp.]|uniref:hypothetical protein n=1 Tax=Nitrosomonas sp. TaxID=42353 RepID=UPI0025D4BAAB|nr:hypothetical protein [Nitrosomonas sp.]MBY0474425.1 hypothetical protein [Nitrosomonas sp.]
MNFPDFYEQAPVVHTYDPFAAVLGAVRGGRFDYHYLDAVRLAGIARVSFNIAEPVAK